jgi:uncharacterized integral membrane protein
MKKLFYVIFIVVIALIGLTFTYKNHQTIHLQYYFGVDVNVELTVLLFITFVLGLLAGYLATVFSTVRTRRKLSRARKEIDTLERVHS